MCLDNEAMFAIIEKLANKTTKDFEGEADVNKIKKSWYVRDALKNYAIAFSSAPGDRKVATRGAQRYCYYAISAANLRDVNNVNALTYLVDDFFEDATKIIRAESKKSMARLFKRKKEEEERAAAGEIPSIYIESQRGEHLD
ncbi:hypothetical protein HNV12_02180 [Methanococcoides sp. SA1]|nr:hypothetical protein [Methanococcoides sp. SA1]